MTQMCFYGRALDSMLALGNVMWPCTRAYECQDTCPTRLPTAQTLLIPSLPLPTFPSCRCPPSLPAAAHLPFPPLPTFPSRPQAQQALSVALNKLGELHHLQGNLAAAAQLYDQALQLRRQLLAATQQQWRQASAEPASAAAAAGGEGEAEGQEACCSAALDLAASCLKLAGARRGLGADAEAEVCLLVAVGQHPCMRPCCGAARCLCATCAAGCASPCNLCCLLLARLQALLSEGAALLHGMEGSLTQQPLRLQRKHAVLAQHAAALAHSATD